MIDLDELDRTILDRLANLGRTPLRLRELVNENRDHDADADEIRRRLVRLEMAGLIASDHHYRVTADGAEVVAPRNGNGFHFTGAFLGPVGSAQNA
jgi:regulator of replication initiation timing